MSTAIEIRTAHPDDLDAMFERASEGFAGSYTPEQREAWRGLFELDRFRNAWDGDELVGVAGSLEKELTLPGGAKVSMAGVTWVSVAATHRRRGLLRRLLGEVHADIDRRGEPVAGLLASEGGIYERFGYGAATRQRSVAIDRRRFQIAANHVPSSGQFRLVNPREHVDTLATLYDRYRRERVGEVSRTAAWIDMRIGGEEQVVRGALHEDGYAIWTVKADWGGFDANHVLQVLDLIACTPDAHVALWNLVLTHDLVGEVRSDGAVALDDHLPLLLTNPRGLVTRQLYDFLWLCPRRCGDLLAARRYRVDDQMVVGVDGERWQVDGGPDGASANATDAEPDVTMTRAALGALVLGGVSATELSLGGRLTGADLARTDLFFGWTPQPHCSTQF
jgi:predicted acetyltransferase